MATLDFLTGFNHRDATAFDVLGNAAGTVTVDTSTVRYVGGSSLKLASAAATTWQSVYPFGGATTSATAFVFVAYIQFSVLPTASQALLVLGSGATAGIGYDAVAGQFCLFTRTTVPAESFLNAAGPSVTTGVWYRIECKINTVANPWVVDGQVAITDGSATAFTQATAAIAAATTLGQAVVAGDLNNSRTFTAFFADVATSMQSADYPIGPISVYGYSPNAVGTHNLDASTSTFFFKEVAAVDSALTTVESTSYQTIDDVPISLDVDAIQVKASLAFNAISRIGSNAVVSATNVPPAHAVGDLILVFAYRSGSATAPSLATGYTDLGTSTVSGGSARSVRMAYKIATATSGEGAAFTNSTDTVTVVYRNAQSPVAGDITFTQGTTQAQTYGAKTISDTSHSWAAGFIGVSLTAAGNASTAPTGMTNITSAGVGPSAGAHDTNAIRGSNWASTNVTGTATGTWITAVIEIKATSTATQPTATWYAEYNFADESVLTSAPLAVRTIAAQALDTATASTWAAKLFDSAQGTNTEDVSNSSISSVTKAYVGKTFAQRPNTGGPWTVAALNAVRLRFGYTAAASGNPRLEAAMLEAVFAVSAASVVTPPHPTVVLQAVPRASTW